MLIVVVFTVFIYLFITKTTGHITKLWFTLQKEAHTTKLVTLQN